MPEEVVPLASQGEAREVLRMLAESRGNKSIVHVPVENIRHDFFHKVRRTEQLFQVVLNLILLPDLFE